MSVEIIPSILSADFGHLVDDVEAALAGGATTVQVDVMDGEFVPNISVGLPVVRALSRGTTARLDVHLMIARPERYVEAFADAGAAVVSVHAEAATHLHRAVHLALELGVQAGVALNPATPITALEEILPDLDVALIMSVNPGFGGQTFLPSVVPKIARLRDEIVRRRCRAVIQVDGGITVDTIAAVVRAGATQIVAGTSVFGAGMPVADALARLHRAVANEAPAR